MKRLHIKQSLRQKYALAGVVIIIVVGLGISLLTSSHAASPYVSIEAESGTLVNGALAETDITGAASGGKYVQFRNPAANTTAGLGTPLTCPAGSVQVSPSSIPSFEANMNYCFASGTYTNFSATIASGDGWYGQGRAILDGNNTQQRAIYNGSTASNVVIDGFTIQHYTLNCTSSTYNCSGGYSVLLREGTNIVVTNNTFQDDYQGGYMGTGGIDLGGDATGGNCSGPGQYPANITSLPLGSSPYNCITNSKIDHNVFNGLGWSGPGIGNGYNNEVNYNVVEDTDEMGQNTEADIAALGKFALDAHTSVIGNYLSDNPENGIWFDVFDVDETIENNTFVGTSTQQSAQSGVFIEISCNAVIENNTFDNIGYSDSGTGNWGAGIRVSSSGSSTTGGGSPNYSVCSDYNAAGAMPGFQGIEITGNTFNNDLDGIALFDGHPVNATQPGSPPIPDTNVTVTGNTINGTTTPAYTQSGRSYTGPNESDSVVTESANPEYNILFTNNTYTLSRPSDFGNSGLDTFSEWKAAGFDTSGSTCKTLSGGAC